VAKTRSPLQHSTDGTRRPAWLKRPLKPVAAAYKIPESIRILQQAHTIHSNGAHDDPIPDNVVGET
jgi:hypothetical protein